MSVKSNVVFGPKLRSHRERRGLTLAALAESLKTKQSLLERLECNDISRWPPGIYGRALLREYAKAIGVSPDEIVEEFCEVLHDAHGEHGEAHVTAEHAVDGLRISFAGPATQTPPVFYRHVMAAAVELAVVLTIAYAVTLVAGSTYVGASASVALIWYPMSAVFGVHEQLCRRLRVRALKSSRVNQPAPAAPSVISVSSESASVH